jgi:hypothetical protein
LNITVRGRWVRPYLGCYLRLIEDDRCSILENSPLLHHFATRDEELLEINEVSFESFATLLHQGVEGGLEDVALVEVGSVCDRTTSGRGSSTRISLSDF